MIITGIPNWPHLQVNIVQEVADTHAHTHIIYIHRYTAHVCMYLCIYVFMYLRPLGLSRINRPEVVSHLRARSVSYRF